MDIADNDGWSCIHLAAESGKSEILQLLLQAENSESVVDTTNKSEDTPMFLAASKGYLDCVKLLNTKGVNLDGKDKDDFTTLYTAAQNGFDNVVR